LEFYDPPKRIPVAGGGVLELHIATAIGKMPLQTGQHGWDRKYCDSSSLFIQWMHDESIA